MLLEAEQKVFKIKERIYQVLKKLDTMCFIVGRVTSFSTKIEFLPSFFF